MADQTNCDPKAEFKAMAIEKFEALTAPEPGKMKALSFAQLEAFGQAVDKFVQTYEPLLSPALGGWKALADSLALAFHQFVLATTPAA